MRAEVVEHSCEDNCRVVRRTGVVQGVTEEGCDFKDFC